MQTTARCLCGQFRAVVTGAPKSVAVCRCLACKRRSGSASAYNAFFDVADDRHEGTHKVHEREGQEGSRFHRHL